MRDRFVVCRNPPEVTRDAAIRERLVAGLEAAIAGSDDLDPAARSKLACDLCGTPTNRRFLRTTKAGLLRIDRAAVAADAKLDGKSSCTPPTRLCRPPTSLSGTSSVSRSKLAGGT